MTECEHGCTETDCMACVEEAYIDGCDKCLSMTWHIWGKCQRCRKLGEKK